MIILKPEQARAMRALLDKEAALQRFTQQVVAQGERRAAELVEESREFWTGVAKEHGINMVREQWVPNEDGSGIRKVAERFDE